MNSPSGQTNGQNPKGTIHNQFLLYSSLKIDTCNYCTCCYFMYSLKHMNS